MHKGVRNLGNPDITLENSRKNKIYLKKGFYQNKMFKRKDEKGEKKKKKKKKKQ